MKRLEHLVLLFGGLLIIQSSSENLKENIALKGKAVQSSTYFTWGAENAIDGIKYAPGEASFCSITSDELSPWWRLDLLDYYDISKVRITNRADCCPQRLDRVEVRIGNSLENNGNDNPKCGGLTSTLPAGKTVTFPCDGMNGRYVNALLPNIHQLLTLCEVEVYGIVNRSRVLLRMGLASTSDEPEVSSTDLDKLQSALGLNSVSDLRLSWTSLPQKQIIQKDKKTRFCPV